MKIVKNNKNRFRIEEFHYHAVDAEICAPSRDRMNGCIFLRTFCTTMLPPTHARKLGQWLIAAADRLEEMRK